jgi:uncharacterized RDD family membrane protein YckC
MSRLVTGEAVALDLRPARLASRMLACVIDVVIELIGFALILWLLSLVPLLGDADLGVAVVLLTIVAMLIGYPVAFETLWRGRTPGKAARGIRVVRDDGGPVRFRHALTRALLNIVERPGLTMGSAAVICSLLSRSGKRLGDVLAGTFVLQERIPKQHLVPVQMPPPLAAWAETLDLSRLPDDLALAARGFLGRAAQLRPDARERLGAELAAAVASYVSPAPPPGAPGWAFLAAVVAERRRREGLRIGGPGSGTPYAPSPWQPAAPSPGWGPAPERPRWGESAPATGAGPSVGPPPVVGAGPPDPGPPRVPSPPSPQWGPAPVPPPAPPAGAAQSAEPRSRAGSTTPAGPTARAKPGARARGAASTAAPVERPDAAPEDGFAVPG